MQVESHEHMARVAASAVTVSDKIRALHAAGYTRSQIADHLGKRYQHVRNVIVEDERRRGAEGAAAEPRPTPRNGPPAASAEPAPSGPRRLSVRADGALQLPPDLAAALGVRAGGEVVAEFDGRSVTLLTPQEALRRAIGLVRRYVPEPTDLVTELLAERRSEAADDER